MPSESIVSDREALERFKEAHPDLGSARQIIAAYSEDAFVQAFAGAFDDGARQARRVYRAAAGIVEKTALIWANIKDAAASPYFNQTLFNNVSPSFIAAQQAIPGYDRLFGNLDFVECDHCRSIFGPAAYFVDLMRFVEKNITQANGIAPDDDLGLQRRRPDLWTTRLDCHNTSDLAPYIDLVNEALEGLMRAGDPYRVLEEAGFPWNLPFNLPLIEIRAYLAQLKTSLARLYQAFEASPGANRGPITREFLDLSPHQFSLLVAEASRPEALSRAYGLDVRLAGPDGAAAAGLENVAHFLAQTGLSRAELNDLVYGDLDQNEMNAGLSRLFFVNNVDDGLGPLLIEPAGDPQHPYERLANLSYQKLDRIHRFVRLARVPGWSFRDLDLALRSLVAPYRPEKALRFDGVSSYAAVAGVRDVALETFTIEAWVNPERHGRNPIVALAQRPGAQASATRLLLFWINRAGELSLDQVDFQEPAGSPPVYAETPPTAYTVPAIPAAAFTHVAVTVEGTKAAFYLNGAPDRTIDLPAPISLEVTDMEIGRDLNDEHFAGIIKDLRIWNVARDAAAIAAGRYRRLTGLENNLLGYWPLTQGRWNRLADLAAGHNDAVAGGGDFAARPPWVERDLVLDPLPEPVDGRGPAFHFDGVDQYLAARIANWAPAPAGAPANPAPQPVPALSSLSVEAWVTLDEAGSPSLPADQPLVAAGNNAAPGIEFELLVDSGGHAAFAGRSVPGPVASTGLLTPGLPAHVAAVVDGSTLSLYLNGVLDTRVNLVPPAAFDLRDVTLTVGSDAAGGYLRGALQEVRVWGRPLGPGEVAANRARAVPSGAAGLLGYWRLNEIAQPPTAGQAAGPGDPAPIAEDLSGFGNPLILGGLPGDSQPERVTVEQLLPQPPVKTTAPALRLDGHDDFLTIGNPAGPGLDTYEQLTVALWFRPDDGEAPERRQLLFSQGDGEAGLNAYLQGGTLYVAAWNADYDLANVQETVFSAKVTAGQWHHLAVTVNDAVSPDFVEFQAYLDGASFTPDADGRKGFRLSPVGPLYLGGLPAGPAQPAATTRFQGAYAGPLDAATSRFAGQLADFRLYRRALGPAEIGLACLAAPLSQAQGPAGPDLVAYLPLDEGQGRTFVDRTGHGRDAVLSEEIIALASAGGHAAEAAGAAYACYRAPEAFGWSSYTYRGRIQIDDPDAGAGVTFLSRQTDAGAAPADRDQFYALWRSKDEPAFHLIAHPAGIQQVTGASLSTGVTPAARAWYRFAVRVETGDSQTTIKARVWPELTAVGAPAPEPAEWQIDAADASHIRIQAGTVGIAAAGPGRVYAAELQVLPNAANAGEAPAAPLLAEYFETYPIGEDPASWPGTRVTTEIQPAAGLFKTASVGGAVAFGIDGARSELQDTYAYPNGSGASVPPAAWTNYTFTGRLRIGDADSAFGLIFFSAYPAAGRFYRIGRFKEAPSFRLDAHPAGSLAAAAPAPSGKLDSGVTPSPDAWYRFRIEAADAGSQTTIRARFWPEGQPEPAGYQIDAADAGPGRLKAGSAGIWARGSGAGYVDDLSVTSLVLGDPVDQAGDQPGTAQIELHLISPDIRKEWWSVVQWQDGQGNWHDVDTWWSQFNDPAGPDRRKWGVDPATLARGGTFRWVVTLTRGGPALFAGKPFALPKRGRSTLTEIHYNRYLAAGFAGSAAGQAPDGWSASATRSVPVEDAALFATVQVKGNRPTWLPAVTDYPLLRHPLNRRALRFAGAPKHQYLAAPDLAGLGAGSAGFTLEAWVQPAEAGQAYPLLQLGGDAAPAVLFGITADGKLMLAAPGGGVPVASADALPSGRFAHVAAVVAGDQVAFYVDGQGGPAGALPKAVALPANGAGAPGGAPIQVGRGPGGQYYAGLLKELSVWASARTADQVAAGRYEQPDVTAPDLAGYWPFGEDEGALAEDAAAGPAHRAAPLRLGGLDSARRPVLAPAPAPTPDPTELNAVCAAGFRGPADAIAHSEPGDAHAWPRRTVEVWFAVDDPRAAGRKQIIYGEGDDARGLVLYVYDGSLFFGGYNTPAGESGWQGTWLEAGGIEPGTWYHAALVLDGRAEVREASLQAYVDGSPVDTGAGSQLYRATGSFSVGGGSPQGAFGSGPGRFHDGPVPNLAPHYLGGRIAGLRVWDTARTPDEIRANAFRQLPGPDPHLWLWWLFDRAQGTQAPDLSGHQRAGVLARPDQVQPIAAVPPYALPRVALDEAALDGIADIKRLKDDAGQDVEPLVALWHTIRHTGRAGSPPLWDRVFNPAGVPLDPWPYYLDAPIRWNPVGSAGVDRQIRARLMVALRIAGKDLNALVARLSGTSLDGAAAPVVVALDTAYLTNLYRLARLPGILGLGMADSLGLLDLLGIPAPNSIADFRRLRDRADWLAQTGLAVADLVYFQADPAAPEGAFTYAGAAVHDLADQLRGQAQDPAARPAVIAGLAALLVAPADLVAAAFAHYEPQVDPQTFIGWMLTIPEAGPVPPDTAAQLGSYLSRLNKTLRLAAQFSLGPAEFAALLEHPDWFGVTDVLRPDLAGLEGLAQFKAFNAAFPDTTGKLLALLALDGSRFDAVVDAIVSLTGWERDQVASLAPRFAGSSATGAANRPGPLARLKTCFDLAAITGAGAGFLAGLAETGDLGYDFYRKEAAALFAVLRSGYDDDAWAGVYGPIRGDLAVRKRDALLSVAMNQALAQMPGYTGRKDPDLLSQYLLLDVQTGSEVQTSRIVQATAALQLYVQRCLMNLEPNVKPELIPAGEWEWMKNYRVWEANRKVFLYPENYIEPELRDDKTPLFAELEQELMQSDVTQESVEKAYTNYLDKFAALAGLRIVGSYVRRIEGDPLPDGAGRVLYLVGQTRTDPRTYYYREVHFQVDQIVRWLPWQKIDLTIHSDYVTPVYAFGRLFLFWIEIVKSTQSQPNVGSAGNHNVDVYTPTLRYSYYNHGKTWIAPQTRLALATLNAVDAAQEKWRRVRVQRGVQQAPPPGPPAAAALGASAAAPAAAQGGIGETDVEVKVLPAGQGPVVKQIAGFDTSQLTWSFWVRADEAPQAPGPARPATQRATVLDYDGGAFTGVLTDTNEVPGGGEAQGLSSQSAATMAGLQDMVQAVQHFVDQFDTAQHDFNQGLVAGAASVVQTAIRDLRNIEALATQAADRLGPAYASRAADLRTAAGQAEQVARQAEVASNAANAANTAANKNDAGQAANRMSAAVTQADAANHDVAATAARIPPLPAPRTLTLSFQFAGETEGAVADALAPVTLASGQWAHVAVTLDYAVDGYTLELFVDGVSQGSRIAKAAALRKQENVALGAPAPALFAAYLAQFELWNFVRSERTIGFDRFYVKQGDEQGLFYLPLDQAAQPGDPRLVLKQRRFAPITLTQQERLIVFYGDGIAGSLRDDAEEQSYKLTFNPEQQARYDLALARTGLEVYVNTFDADQNNRAIVTQNGITLDLRLYTPELLAAYIRLSLLPASSAAAAWAIQAYLNWLQASLNPANLLLSNLQPFASGVVETGNQPGWYILDTTNEQFLVRADVRDVASSHAFEYVPETVEDRLLFLPGKVSDPSAPQPIGVYLRADQAGPLDASGNWEQYDPPGFKYAFERLTTYAAHDLSLSLFRGGLDALISVDSQLTPEWDFRQYAHNPDRVKPPRNFRSTASNEPIDFNGAYGAYYWEIFFHIPFLIANRLNENQRFAEAQKWYQYIFDPTARLADVANVSVPEDRYWRFLPFRNVTMERLAQSLEDPATLAAYHADPFNPHAIARLRLVAYQKAIVMKYIDNLLDWGDYLFGQDTRESINEAALLYVQAYNLLGPRPEGKPVRNFTPAGTYQDIKQQYDGNAPEFLAHLETAIASSNGHGAGTGTPVSATPVSGAAAASPNHRVTTDFCVMENEQFMGYWDRVQDRLFKIRHSQNLEGITRQLALFQPPINPLQLVQALAAGRSIEGALANLSAAIPPYRYLFMIDRARAMASTAIDLGAALLGALETRDAQQLEILANTQETAILNLTTQIKQNEVNSAQQEIAGLQITRQNLQNKFTYYQALFNLNLSPEEIAALVLGGLEIGSKTTATILEGISSIAFEAPDFLAGIIGIEEVAIGLYGGHNVADGVDKAAVIFNILSEILATAGEMTEKIGEYKLRQGERQLEMQTAQYELNEIDNQIAVAQLALANAQQELQIHLQDIANHQQVADFYRTKFTGQDLYGWMIARVSGLYFQAYRLAFDMAKTAERAFQYELGTDDTFVGFGHWDSLRKGLLAGEALLLDLNRMDKAFLDRDRRRLEINKQVSLARTFPQALAALKATGTCTFDLTELMYDKDFPGHYARMLKTMAVSVQVDNADPIDQVKAMLTQLSNSVLLEPNVADVRYLLKVDGAGQPGDSKIRKDLSANQQIAISTVTDDGDPGMFNLDFIFDNRYFPFEATGAVSSWRLDVPKDTNTFDFTALKDVVIHIRYTARSAGDPFRQQVLDAVKKAH